MQGQSEFEDVKSRSLGIRIVFEDFEDMIK